MDGLIFFYLLHFPNRILSSWIAECNMDNIVRGLREEQSIYIIEIA
jgi:hypothetical protein